MEPPSHELLQAFSRLGLTGTAELSGTESLVRRIAGGLPIHDGLWIDALVRRGKVTPFQAKLLDERRHAELSVGDKFVLLRPRHLDPVISLFDGREISTGRGVHVARIPRILCNHDAAQRLNQIAGTRIVCQSSAFLDVVSQGSPGESLSRYLVRRGRFPEQVVQAISLAILEQLTGSGSSPTGVHGDLRIENILLDCQGRISIINAGVRNAIFPCVTLHTRLPWDAYDGLAPELLEPGATATQASDIYSLGCLLWQLLAGRAPFLPADPLAKIKSHRTQTIADIREIAPDTTDQFAGLIRQMTAREPHHRPQSYGELLTAVRALRRRPGSRLRQFATGFESAAPRSEFGRKTRSTGRTAQAAVMLVMTCGLAWLFWNRSEWGFPALEKVAAVTASSQTRENGNVPVRPPVSAALSTTPDNGLQPLPVPDSQGVVRLDSEGEYVPAAITVPGPLRIQGPAGGLARIRIAETPLQLEGTSVTIENVEFVRLESSGAHPLPGAAVVVDSRELIVRGCVARQQGVDLRPATLVDWTISSGGSAPSGRLLVRNSLVPIPSTVVSVNGQITVALFEDVYKQGAGALLSVTGGAAAGFRVPMRLDHCTLRDSGAIVAFADPKAFLASGLLSVQGRDSVIQLAPREPLIRLPEGVELESWEKHLEIVAEGFVVHPETEIVGLVPVQSDEVLPLPTDNLAVEGLITAGFHFAPGEPGNRGVSTLVLDEMPMKVSSEPIGVRVEHLPSASR